MTTAPSPQQHEGPRYSIVTAVYNVAAYLPEFIASIDAQTFGTSALEVVAVDDGSTDSSLAMLHAWAERAPYPVTVLTKENGGQSTARNLGLEHARGEWVTFTDPDDVLGPKYLASVDAFLAEHQQAVMVACNLILLQDSTGAIEDRHPLRYRFRGKAQIHDLETKPAFFFGSAPAAFYRRSDVAAQGLRFDPAIRPNFEDGVFTSLYLLGFERPLVGFVPGAHYRYRKRSDNSSTMGQSVVDSGRYTTVVRLGYRDLLRAAAALKGGRVPEWLQNQILYELSWLFTLQLRSGGASSPAVEAAGEEFHALMADVVELLDADVIDGSPVSRLNRFWRDVLLHAWSDQRWCQPQLQLTHFDRAQGLVRVQYRYVGEAPEEVCLSGGLPVTPVHAKVRDAELLGRVVMHERILWLPAGRAIRIKLDGHAVPMDWELPRPRYRVSVPMIRQNLDRQGLRTDRFVNQTDTPEVELDSDARRTLRQSRSKRVRRRYADAWTVMDRVHNAGDNGQRLFEYLRAERPEINAWFVIRPDAPEWAGLRKQYGRRVVAYGSRQWKLLLLNTEHLISSHADQPITSPFEITADLGVVPTWRFTFLQHGVIKDDLSNWLNPKPIDTFVTSTRAEQESIAGDHNSYVFTTREAKLTGLPRFDRLLQVGNRVPVAERDLILVAPTWRNWLTAPITPGTQERTAFAGFAGSEFAESWLGVLGSERLAAAAAELGCTVAFLPHPNLKAATADLTLPEHVRLLNFEDFDVQELFARAAVLVTDYSSMAFNAAYIERPVVYFQFDRDRVLGGEHVGGKGYFEYERDGYGPVVLDLDSAIAASIAAARTRVPEQVYLDRIEAAFPDRDGRCCERVVAAIEASARRHNRPAG